MCTCLLLLLLLVAVVVVNSFRRAQLLTQALDEATEVCERYRFGTNHDKALAKLRFLQDLVCPRCLSLLICVLHL